jgi:hypothetical protein
MPMFINNPIVSLRKTPINTQISTCRKFNSFTPTMNPSISSLSNTISAPGVYSLIYINGQNFLPYNTTINFGTTKNIPIVLYSSFYISFVVPLNVSEGTYPIQVVVNYNNTKSLTSSLLYSNIVPYTIQNYTITGNYNVSDDNKYNTIISFTSSGNIVFYNQFKVLWKITGDASVSLNDISISDGTYKTITNTPYYANLGTGSVSLSFNV